MNQQIILKKRRNPKLSAKDPRKKLKLTNFQKKVLIGILLGDAHLQINKNGTCRLFIEQSVKDHQDYAYHLYDVFKEFCLSPPVLREKRQHVFIRTMFHASFRFYGKLFYKKVTGLPLDAKVRHKKVIPKNIHKFLNPVSLAYWYMDDGALKGKNRYGKRLHTEGFNHEEVEKLCNAMRNFGIQTNMHRQYDKRLLYITQPADPLFTEMIYPHVVPSMRYKLFNNEQFDFFKRNVSNQRFSTVFSEAENNETLQDGELNALYTQSRVRQKRKK
jgi:hypothetical protein